MCEPANILSERISGYSCSDVVHGHVPRSSFRN